MKYFAVKELIGLWLAYVIQLTDFLVNVCVHFLRLTSAKKKNESFLLKETTSWLGLILAGFELMSDHQPSLLHYPTN